MITPTDFVRKFDKNIDARGAYEIAKFALRELDVTHEVKIAIAFLAGVLLHVARCDETPDKTLRGVANYLNDPEKPFLDILQAMLVYPHDPEHAHGWVTPGGSPTATMPQVAFVARMLLDLADWQRDNILAIALAPLLHDVFTEDLYRYESKTASKSTGGEAPPAG